MHGRIVQILDRNPENTESLEYAYGRGVYPSVLIFDRSNLEFS